MSCDISLNIIIRDTALNHSEQKVLSCFVLKSSWTGAHSISSFGHFQLQVFFALLKFSFLLLSFFIQYSFDHVLSGPIIRSFFQYFRVDYSVHHQFLVFYKLLFRIFCYIKFRDFSHQLLKLLKSRSESTNLGFLVI
jgi:hypothetical protein